ncbi:hypothetical protein [Providencia phage PSTCR5]|uniref:I-spanin n=1 Tax=Providencia phage PSTCR5 TaxID=2783547 RepID=A0A873WS87_9CAUD|nr:hypothetical protein KNV68_gp100 [Providencia phage PSTCR5]QPB12198.1 hypothetical protein [Providencia phage PSTCR5]
MEQGVKQLSKTAGFFSIISANWATILILILLILSGIRMIYTQEKTIEIISNTNDIYAASYNDIRKSMNNLRLQMEENNKRLDAHYSTINRNLNISEARIAALEKAASRASTFEAKPGLTTLKAKKAIKENEENFSCLTGNTDYCSSSPAQ